MTLRKIAVLTFILTAATLALAQDSLSLLSGAWRMTSLESGTEVGNLQEVPYSGEIVFADAGTISVQAMNPDADAAPTPYTVNGYEAFYGNLTIDEAAKTFVVRVDSALVRDLIGQDLERAFEVSKKPACPHPDEPGRILARYLRAPVRPRDWQSRSTQHELGEIMNLSFENQVALVTGSGLGMGLATAKAFAEAGATVVLADINEDSVQSVAEELTAAGHQALAIRCDVGNEASVAAMVEHTVAAFGRLDAAFNNAGVQSPAVETADATGEEFERVNAINLRGVWNCM